MSTVKPTMNFTVYGEVVRVYIPTIPTTLITSNKKVGNETDTEDDIEVGSGIDEEEHDDEEPDEEEPDDEEEITSAEETEYDIEKQVPFTNKRRNDEGYCNVS